MSMDMCMGVYVLGMTEVDGKEGRTMILAVDSLSFFRLSF